MRVVSKSKDILSDIYSQGNRQNDVTFRSTAYVTTEQKWMKTTSQHYDDSRLYDLMNVEKTAV